MSHRFTKEERMTVYQKYDGHCAYCGKSIRYDDMQVDHLIPQYHYDSSKFVDEWDKIDTLENWMPSCRRCNNYKRAHTLESFRHLIETIPIKLERGSFIYKVGMDYGFYDVEPKHVKFFFEWVEEHE